MTTTDKKKQANSSPETVSEELLKNFQLRRRIVVAVKKAEPKLVNLQSVRRRERS